MQGDVHCAGEYGVRRFVLENCICMLQNILRRNILLLKHTVFFVLVFDWLFYGIIFIYDKLYIC